MKKVLLGTALITTLIGINVFLGITIYQKVSDKNPSTSGIIAAVPSLKPESTKSPDNNAVVPASDHKVPTASSPSPTSSPTSTPTPGGEKKNQSKGTEQKISQYGNLKGTITWQYNNFVGTKGDVGALIYLLPIDLKKDSMTDEQANLLTLIGKAPPNSNIFYTKANGYGSYEINQIPVGTYYAVIISKNTTRNAKDEKEIDQSVRNILEPMLKDWTRFYNYRLQFNKHFLKKVEIKENQTVDVSEDFGFTYF